MIPAPVPPHNSNRRAMNRGFVRFLRRKVRVGSDVDQIRRRGAVGFLGPVPHSGAIPPERSRSNRQDGLEGDGVVAGNPLWDDRHAFGEVTPSGCDAVRG
jgi:hypothetical protein